MSETELGRIKSDLTIIQQTLGLPISFGKEMLVFGLLFTGAAICAAGVSLATEKDWLQITLMVAMIMPGPFWLYFRSRRTTGSNLEIEAQVAMSCVIYAVVWIAACGYAMADIFGPSVGVARTAGLYACSIVLLFVFSLIVIHMALKSRERYYCLGLSVSLLLAGLLIPLLNRHYSYALAHCCMAVGFLTSVLLQWIQLRKVMTHKLATHHAAD